MTDIGWERRKLREQGLTFRTRTEWGARESYLSERTCDSVAAAFFLHIAVVDDPSDLLGTEDEVARNVERIGQSRFGSGMSYNVLAFNTGRLYEGQPLTRRGTHTVNTFRRDVCPVHGGPMTGPVTSTGYNLNVNVRALCLPQQVDDAVTDEQLDAAARWAAAQIRAGLARRDARWHGHRCVTAKACPGQRAFDRIDELQALTDHYVMNGLEDDMALSDDDKAWIQGTIREELRVDFGDGRKWTDDQVSRTVIRKLDNILGRVDMDAFADAVAARLPSGSGGGAFTAEQVEQVKEAVKQADREGTG